MKKITIINERCIKGVYAGGIIFKVGIIFLISFQNSCKKLVEIPPPAAAVSGNNVYTTDATAISVLSGLYTLMSSSNTFSGTGSIGFFTGLSSDELKLYDGVTNPVYIDYYRNSLSAVLPTSSSGSELWNPLYNYVFKCNAAIEGLSSSNAEVLTPNVKLQLLGEAKFMRAFIYFHLINLFGDVPLALTTDPKVNTLLPRSNAMEAYEQVIKDLKEAQELLSEDFLKENLQLPTTERVRPTKWAATALLSRVYLYLEDYINAEIQSSFLINNPVFKLAEVNEVFLKNSLEAIWQLQPTTLNFNTQDARTYIIPPNGPSEVVNPVFLSRNLLERFDSNDKRAELGNWIDRTIYKVASSKYDTVYFPYKYKINAQNANINAITGTSNMKEYQMVLRLAEQYLIRAEARANSNDINGAKLDLNSIRTRAGLSPTTANDKASLLADIFHERQVELFAEYGHRWFDLKRSKTIDIVMAGVTPSKANGNVWQSYQQLYPLPQLDLQLGPNLVQNIGY